MDSTRNKINITAREIIIAAAMGTAAALLIVLLAAFALNASLLPNELADKLALAAVFCGAAVGGLCAGKRGRGALLGGLFSGITMAAVIFVGALTASAGAEQLGSACLRSIIAAAAGGLFGGALHVGGRRANRRKKRRR